MADFEYQQPQRFRVTNKQREEQKKRKSGSSGGIPDRWLDYLGVNTWIENTRFVAFKCPLKPEMQKHLTDDRRFTLGDLVERLDDMGKEIGLIIDLTNTKRYYAETDIIDAQMQYYKLMTAGHTRTPSEDCYKEFAGVVRQFLEQNKHNEKLIGVHCTHGLNRTGYLIVRYMIEEMNFEPQQALEAFNRARGHSMEKYTDDLLRCGLHATNPQANLSSTGLVNTASTSTDQVQWPTLYSAMENMSLQEQRLQRRQRRSEQITTSTSMQNYNDQQSPRSANFSNNHYGNHSFRSQGQGHGRSSSYQQNSSSQNFYRQTSVTPRILTSSCTNEENSNQTPSAFFGSGSNVGRGRPMTGDR